MNKEIYDTIENAFITKCIKKEYRDRMVYELQSRKKREKALSRFAHSAEEVLQEHFSLINVSDLQNWLELNINKTEKCYVISSGVYDKSVVAFDEALNILKQSYMTVILIFDKCIVVKEECCERKFYLSKLT